MKVRTVMSRPVKSVAPGASISEVARVMDEACCGSVPVVAHDGALIGIVTDRDICLALAKKNLRPSEMLVEDVMKRDVHSCGPEDEIETALQAMRRHQVRRLPVLSDTGRLAGILSIDDVMLHAEEARGKVQVDLTYGQAVNTLRAINEGRIAVRTIVQP